MSQLVSQLLPHLVDYGKFITDLNSVLQTDYENVKEFHEFFTTFETVSWYTENIEGSIMLLISLGSIKSFEMMPHS